VTFERLLCVLKFCMGIRELNIPESTNQPKDRFIFFGVESNIKNFRAVAPEYWYRPATGSNDILCIQSIPR